MAGQLTNPGAVIGADISGITAGVLFPVKVPGTELLYTKRTVIWYLSSAAQDRHFKLSH